MNMGEETLFKLRDKFFSPAFHFSEIGMLLGIRVEFIILIEVEICSLG